MYIKFRRALAMATLCLGLSGISMAQSPELINYQAIIRNASGEAIASAPVGIEFSILKGSATGSAVYSETHTATTNDFGLVNLKLGSGASSQLFEDIDWSAGPYFLAISLDLNGGSNYTQFGVTELVSVPFALYAKHVENDMVDDADADPNNEIQSLSLANDTLYLSQGGNVDLSNFNQSSQFVQLQSQFDSTTISILNEMQQDSAALAAAISLVSTDLNDLTAQHNADSALFMSYIGMNASAISAHNSADGDLSSTNEIQTLSLSGDNLSLTSGGNVDLSGYDQTNDVAALNLELDADSATFANGIASNASGIAANQSAISTNASNIASNTSAINANAANIASNTSAIGSNVADIANNASSISTNATNIAANQSAISTNASNITSNTSAINANASNIASNTSAIGSNVADIANNASSISTNATNIAANQSAISTNASNIASNTSAINANASNIASNTSAISSNIADIANNASSISTNATNIAANQISLNAHISADLDTDNTNEIQDLQLTGSTLSITGNANATAINLAPFTGTNTDNQTLSVSGTSLSITGGNSVDLSSLQDGTGTDNQQLSISGTNLNISGGNSVNLSSLQDGTGTDNQTLNLTGTTLAISSGNSVNLSSLQDGTGTDSQQLSISGNVISISGGNSITLPSTSAGNDTVGIEGVLLKDNNAVGQSIRNLNQISIGDSNLFSNVAANVVNSGNTNNYGVYSVVNDSTALNNYTIRGQATGAQSWNIAVAGVSSGNASSIDYGVYGEAQGNSNQIKRGVVGVTTGPVSDNDAAVYGIANGSGDNISLYGRAIFSNPSGTNTGLLVNAANAGSNRAIHALAGDVIVNDNVGVGTSTPNAKLDVQGTAIIDTLQIGNYNMPVSDGGNGQVLTTDGAGNVNWQTPSSGSATPWTTSGANIYRSTGTVSIGGPAVVVDKFQVNSTNNTYSLFSSGYFRTTGTTNGQNRGIVVQSDGSNSGSNVGILVSATNSSDNVAILANNGAVVINDQVRIGTTLNNGKVNVIGSTGGVYSLSNTNSTNDWENYGVNGSANTANNPGRGLSGSSFGANSGWGVFGEATTSASNTGLAGYGLSTSANSATQTGVYGQAGVTWGGSTPGTGAHYGGYFIGEGGGSWNHGLYSRATSTSAANNRGVEGVANSALSNSNIGGIFFGNGSISGTNYGVAGIANNSSATNYGIYGQSSGAGTNQTAVYGYSNGTSGFNAGVDGTAVSTGATNIGVGGYSYGSNTGTNKNYGIYGYAQSADTNYGVYSTVTGSGNINYGVYAKASGATTNVAGYFLGNVTIAGNLNVTGSMSKGSGTFKIDHPADPENKYLVHSFVESPEMMNVYNGNITTDANGFATVVLPDYFELANRDFRYQLTAIGTFAQAIVAEEISGNTFVIQTSQPNTKVSWQVTGVRNDPYAQQNRIEPVQAKVGEEQGKYLHPEVYGQPNSKALYQSSGEIDVQSKENKDVEESLQQSPDADVKTRK